MSETKKLFENIQQNLKESDEDNIDVVESTIAKNGEDYGVIGVVGKNNKILVKTKNGNYWFIVSGDKIKISSEKGNQPVVRTSRGKMQTPSINLEVDGVFKNPIQAALDALDKLEPTAEDEYIIQIGDNFFGGYDDNNEIILKGDSHSANRYTDREEAENIASQVNGEVVVESEELKEDVATELDDYNADIKIILDGIEKIRPTLKTEEGHKILDDYVYISVSNAINDLGLDVDDDTIG